MSLIFVLYVFSRAVSFPAQQWVPFPMFTKNLNASDLKINYQEKFKFKYTFIQEKTKSEGSTSPRWRTPESYHCNGVKCILLFCILCTYKYKYTKKDTKTHILPCAVIFIRNEIRFCTIHNNFLFSANMWSRPYFYLSGVQTYFIFGWTPVLSVDTL